MYTNKFILFDSFVQDYQFRRLVDGDTGCMCLCAALKDV